ncbi:MAG: ABC transporter permease [Hyphomicrobiales bacterium]
MNAAARRAGLLAPSMLAIGVLLVLPLCLMAFVSTLERGPDGGVIWSRHTLDAYAQFLFERDLMDNLVLNTDYMQIFARSIGLAATTAVLTLLIAFPMALWMAFQPPSRRTFLLFVVTVPFWTNLLVRNYSWILMLRNGGVLDWALMGTGLRHEPLNILYSPLATGIGLVYSFLPFMILPIYVSLEKLDRRLIEAAFDLGADRLHALIRIILPLSMPGIVGGLILVFVPCLGAFVTPALLGGGKSLMIGSLIQQQFGQSRNWPFGAALAFVLLALVLFALSLHALRYRWATGRAS